MHKLQITLYVLAATAVITGLMDLFMGLASIKPFSEGLPAEFLNDELYNAQYRFLGGVWLGLGVMLYVVAKDINKYSTILKLLLGSIFLGGLGRLITILTIGLPENSAGKAFVLITIAIELVCISLIYWWHTRLSARNIK